MKKLTRIGAYGICLEDDRLLLVPKKSGPYKGQLDLPGGAMEFGESPEQTLLREFAEEVASGFKKAEQLCNLSCVTNAEFYHIGLIYTVQERYSLPGITAEDEFYWIEFSQLANIALTPFASQAINYVKI